MESEENKITESEMIVMGGFLFATDGVCFLIDLTLYGAAITPVIQSTATFATSWWLQNKGSENAFKIGKQLAQHAANLLPLLPTLTTSFAINVYLHNHPQITQTVGSVTGKVTGFKISKTSTK